MKKYIFVVIIIILSFFIDIPNYIELNNLKVIESIKVDCSDNTYYLTEVIPMRDDGGIEYKKIIHKFSYKEIKNNDKLFLRDVKRFTSNCDNYNEIIKNLRIKPKKIKRS